MKEINRWMIGLNALGGAAIFFILLIVPPYLTAFLENNEPLPELKAQEINPWIDESITELNDLTLRQVFENGELGLNYFNSLNEATVIKDNLEYTISGDGIIDFPYARWRITSGYDNQTLYAVVNVLQKQEEEIVRVGFVLPQSDFQSVTDLGIYTFKTDVFSPTNISLEVRPYIREPKYSYDIKLELRVYNFSALGIDNLTKEQMDYYYGRYLRYKDSTVNDYTTVFNNYLSLAPDSNPLEVVKPIEYYMNVILDTYDTISNFWNNVSNLFVTDIIQDNAFEIYDKWWFKPFLWLIGD